MILAVWNQKGGVAKTVTATALGATLPAALGATAAGRRRPGRVLVVDLDSQASASLALGVARSDLEPSAASVLLDDRPADRCTRPTGVEGMDLLTGSPRLANADVALADVEGRESVLASALAPIAGDYGAVLLDCPPGLSLLTVNALVAADTLLVPVVPEYLAIEGLASLLETVQRVRQGIGARVELLGLLLARVDLRTRAAREYTAELRAHYGADVFRAEIPTSSKVAEAPSHGRVITDYAPSSRAALAYRDLAAEVVARMEGRKGGRKAGRTSSHRGGRQ